MQEKYTKPHVWKQLINVIGYQVHLVPPTHLPVTGIQDRDTWCEDNSDITILITLQHLPL